MKAKLFIFMLIACALGTVSCASKKVANQQPPYPNYAGQPQQPYYGQPQPYYGQPQPPQPKQTESGFTVIEESPIMLLSMDAPQGEMRAYGEGESPDSQLALNIAKSQAVAALQSQIETFVKYAINRYNDQTTINGATSLDQKTREDLITLSKGTVQGAVILDSRKLYNAKIGIYKCEVCVKYDKAGVIGVLEEQSQRILKNREKFLEDMKEVWDEYDRSQGRKTQAELENEEKLRIEASKNAMEQENLDRQNAREIDKINTYGQNIANIEAQKQAANAPAIYYYSVNATQYGPVNIHQLGGLAKNGQITIYTSIWREGLAAWTPAGQLPELRTSFASAPGSIPPPPPAY